MRLFRSLTLLVAASAVAFAFSACRSSKEDTNTYTFDPAAHQRAVDLKSKVLAIMANSLESFSAHRAEVEATNADLAQAHELSATAPDNQAVTGEWAAMKDPAGPLYGGYVSLWQARGRMDEATRDAATARVTAHLDYILCLEAAKRTKAGICAPPETAAPATAEPGAAPATPPPA